MDSADAVIIGGGAIGASTLYHLRRLGVDNVTLLERDTLSSGSTSKSAGGIRCQFSDELNIRMALRSLDEFEHFEERTGAQIDFHQNGYLFLDPDVPRSRRLPNRNPASALARSRIQRTDRLGRPRHRPADQSRGTRRSSVLSARRPRNAGGRRLRLCVQLGRRDPSRVCGDRDPGQRRPDRCRRHCPGPNRN